MADAKAGGARTSEAGRGGGGGGGKSERMGKEWAQVEWRGTSPPLLLLLLFAVAGAFFLCGFSPLTLAARVVFGGGGVLRVGIRCLSKEEREEEEEEEGKEKATAEDFKKGRVAFRCSSKEKEEGESIWSTSGRGGASSVEGSSREGPIPIGGGSSGMVVDEDGVMEKVEEDGFCNRTPPPRGEVSTSTVVECSLTTSALSAGGGVVGTMTTAPSSFSFAVVVVVLSRCLSSSTRGLTERCRIPFFDDHPRFLLAVGDGVARGGRKKRSSKGGVSRDFVRLLLPVRIPVAHHGRTVERPPLLLKVHGVLNG